VGKGTTVERLEITQRRKFPGLEILLQGRNFCPWTKFSVARNSRNFRPFEIRLSPLQNVVVQRSVKGPKILVWQNFRGPEISQFLALENSAKFLTKGCGATL
jgi:hypothetical protein